MPTDADNLLNEAAEALKNKEYATAERLQRQGCQLLREQDCQELRLASELETLADTHYVQRKFQECVTEYAEAVRLREKLSTETDRSILRPLYGLAKSHFERQNYEAAEVEMRRLLSFTEVRDNSPESLAFSLYELGWLLYYTGKYKEAEPYLLKALSIGEHGLGSANRQALRTLGALALLYKNCSDLGKDPEPYFRRVIDATKSDKQLQVTYITNLYRLASHLAESKRFDRADELFLQVLEFLNDLPRPSEMETDWITSGCVGYFQSRGKGEVVQSLASEQHGSDAYHKVVQERLRHAEQTLSPDDPEFAEALLAAGNDATFEGNYREAEALLVRGLEAHVRIHGPESSEALFALTRVCIIKRILSKFDEAETAIQQAVEGARKTLFNEGFYPWALENLALLREAQGKHDDAEKIYADASREYERICGFPSYRTFEGLYHQTGFLLRMGKLELAEAVIRRAVNVMDVVSDLSAGEKADYLATLATILEAMARQPEAEETHARAKKLYEQSEAAHRDEFET